MGRTSLWSSTVGMGWLLSAGLWGCVSEPPPEDLESGDTAPTSLSEHGGADTGESGSADEEPAPACEAGDVQLFSGIRFRCIPAGTFEMGCVPGRDDVGYWGNCYDYEFPSHEVSVSRVFWLMESELTQAQFEELLDYQPAHFPRTGLGRPVATIVQRRACGGTRQRTSPISYRWS